MSMYLSLFFLKYFLILNFNTPSRLSNSQVAKKILRGSQICDSGGLHTSQHLQKAHIIIQEYLKWISC